MCNVWVRSTRLAAAAVFSVGIAMTSAASADEFTDTVQEVLELYQDGEISEAREALKYAEQLLVKQEIQAIEKFFPEPLDGWTVATAKRNRNAGFAALGGFAVNRAYSKGRERVTMTVAGNSPMIQQFSMLFSNPAMLQSSGGRMMRMKRQKVIIMKDGNVQTLVDKRFLVMVEGKADEQTKIAFLKKFDFRGLAKFR